MSMERTISMLAIAVSLGLAGPTAAQDASGGAETDAPAAPETATEEAAPGDAAAEPADTAGATRAAGDPAEPEVLEVVKEVFGDWEVRCSPNGEDCFMYQLALDPQDNPVAEVSMIKLPDSNEASAGVTMVTPLGTLLPAGVVLQIDEGEMRQYPFNWCSQVGCFARFGLTDQSVNAMKRGRAAKVTLASFVAPDRPVTLELSLTGFTDGFNSLEPTTLGGEPTPPQQ